jgi:CRP-like cAMP-binding protein
MALDDDIAALSGAPLFNLMDGEALRLIAFASEHRTLKAGEVLFAKGERSNGGFVVTRGSIALERDEGTPCFVAEPGALIGQMALFARTTRPATARAREASAVLRISPMLMRRVLQEFPSTAEALRGALTDELAAVTGGLVRIRERLLAVDREPDHQRADRASLLSNAPMIGPTG